jgi:hypothetical protein
MVVKHGIYKEYTAISRKPRRYVTKKKTAVGKKLGLGITEAATFITQQRPLSKVNNILFGKHERIYIHGLHIECC